MPSTAAPDYDSIQSTGCTIGNGLGIGPGQLIYQFQCGVASDGSLWLTDYGSHRLLHFRQSGELIQTFGTVGNHPSSIAVSHLGSSLFVMHQSRLKEYNQRDGVLVRTVGMANTGPEMDCACGMSLSPGETLLAVACAQRHCISLIDMEGGVAPFNTGAM